MKPLVWHPVLECSKEGNSMGRGMWSRCVNNKNVAPMSDSCLHVNFNYNNITSNNVVVKIVGAATSLWHVFDDVERWWRLPSTISQTVRFNQPIRWRWGPDRRRCICTSPSRGRVRLKFVHSSYPCRFTVKSKREENFSATFVLGFKETLRSTDSRWYIIKIENRGVVKMNTKEIQLTTFRCYKNIT